MDDLLITVFLLDYTQKAMVVKADVTLELTRGRDQYVVVLVIQVDPHIEIQALQVQVV